MFHLKTPPIHKINPEINKMDHKKSPVNNIDIFCQNYENNLQNSEPYRMQQEKQYKKNLRNKYTQTLSDNIDNKKQAAISKPDALYSNNVINKDNIINQKFKSIHHEFKIPTIALDLNKIQDSRSLLTQFKKMPSDIIVNNLDKGNGLSVEKNVNNTSRVFRSNLNKDTSLTQRSNYNSYKNIKPQNINLQNIRSQNTLTLNKNLQLDSLNIQKMQTTQKVTKENANSRHASDLSKASDSKRIIHTSCLPSKQNSNSSINSNGKHLTTEANNNINSHRHLSVENIENDDKDKIRLRLSSQQLKLKQIISNHYQKYKAKNSSNLSSLDVNSKSNNSIDRTKLDHYYANKNIYEKKKKSIISRFTKWINDINLCRNFDNNNQKIAQLLQEFTNIESLIIDHNHTINQLITDLKILNNNQNSQRRIDTISALCGLKINYSNLIKQKFNKIVESINNDNLICWQTLNQNVKYLKIADINLERHLNQIINNKKFIFQILSPLVNKINNNDSISINQLREIKYYTTQINELRNILSFKTAKKNTLQQNIEKDKYATWILIEQNNKQHVSRNLNIRGNAVRIEKINEMQYLDQEIAALNNVLEDLQKEYNLFCQIIDINHIDNDINISNIASNLYLYFPQFLNFINTMKTK